MSVSMVGLDTAKSVFQVHAVDHSGKVEIKRKLQRSGLITFFEKQGPCTIVMEACGAAHHWGRLLTALGHDVKLIAPEAVKPFVKKGRKNDAADAAAICEAASRPDVKFVPVKSVEQQAILALHAVRSLLVKQQTMLANAMRGIATEFGVIVPKGVGKLKELMALVDADRMFPVRARQAARELFDQSNALAESIMTFEAEIVAHARRDETARRLATIPGVGPITASLIAATVSDISVFKSCPTLCCLARLGATTALHWRQDPPWPDHQVGQPGDKAVAGDRSDVDDLPSPAMEKRSWGVGQGHNRAATCQAG